MPRENSDGKRASVVGYTISAGTVTRPAAGPPSRFANAPRANGKAKATAAKAGNGNSRGLPFDLDSDDEATLDSF